MDDISKLVLAVLSSGVVGALITAIFQHRKLGADATEVITKAAASMVDTMQNRMEDQEAEIKELRSRIKAQGLEIEDLQDRDREHQAFKRSLARRAQRQTEWAKKIVKIVHDLDPTVEIEEPPSLSPEY